MAKILKVILLGFLGAVLLVGGFSGGFIAGHAVQLGSNPVAGLALPIPTVAAGTSATAAPEDTATLFKPFWDAWKIIHEQYVDQPVDDTKLMEGAIRGMVDSLGDPHSSYMDAKTFSEANQDLAGSYEGIGAVVDTTKDYLTVISTFPESPAEKAGILSGDQIIAVDGTDMTGTNPELVRQKVIGPAGSQVKLTIKRADAAEPLQFAITRAQIIVVSASGKMLPDGIAYVQITTFGEKTTSELKAALTTLMAQNPKGLILDLRDNGGGYLQTAVEVVSQFTSQSPVLFEQAGDGSKKSYDAQAGGLATQVPMVVLINEGSASASEITAGALQDDARAKLVGVVSYGKGSVQNWVPIANNEGAIRITIARWLTPSGRLIDKVGLTPDVYVTRTAEQRAAGVDPQLDTALATLKAMIAGSAIPTSMPTPTSTPKP